MDNLSVPTNYRLFKKIADYMCAWFHFLAWPSPENLKPRTLIDLPVHGMMTIHKLVDMLVQAYGEQGKPNNILSKCLSHCISK